MKLSVESVRNRLVRAAFHVSVGIRNLSGVHVVRRIEPRLHRQVVQVGVECALAVVVVNLPAIEHCMADAKIEEWLHSVRTLLLLRFGKIRIARSIHAKLQHGMVDDKLAQIPLLLQHGNYAHANPCVLHLKQRSICERCSSMHHQSVEIGRGADAAEMQRVVLQLHLHAEALAGRLLHLGEDVVVEALAVQQRSNGDSEHNGNSRHGGECPQRDALNDSRPTW